MAERCLRKGVKMVSLRCAAAVVPGTFSRIVGFSVVMGLACGGAEMAVGEGVVVQR